MWESPRDDSKGTLHKSRQVWTLIDMPGHTQRKVVVSYAKMFLGEYLYAKS